EGALQDFINDGGGFLGIRDAAKAQQESDWFTGLIGARPAGTRPTAEKVAEVTASGENPPREVAANLTDDDKNTKWLAFADTATITYQLAEPAVITQYAMVSANDFPGRDPQTWSLKASADGENWTEIDSRSEDFSQRFMRKEYELENSTEYQYFQLQIT